MSISIVNLFFLNVGKGKEEKADENK